MNAAKSTVPVRKGWEFVEYGERPCDKCGKPHACWREKKPPGYVAYTSWADPTDGHPYRPTPWEVLGRRWLAEHPVERAR